jgi:hypothetical protein
MSFDKEPKKLPFDRVIVFKDLPVHSYTPLQPEDKKIGKKFSERTPKFQPTISP